MSFAPLFEVLPGDLHLLAWNAPGYLGSDPLPSPWPIADDYAARLATFLDALGFGRVNLVGHSLGTLMAAAFARDFPDRVQSLTLAAAANGYGVPRGGTLPDKACARLEDLARLGPQAFAMARGANLVHDPENNADIVGHVTDAMSRIEPHGYGQAVRMLASGDLPGNLAHVPARPRFIIGAQDRITPRTQTDAAAAAWANAHGAHPEITEIEGAGHAVYLQQPDAFCAALLTTLSAATAQTREGA